MCGENESGSHDNHRPKGSSPRVRGKPGTREWVMCGTRLIPACAGKTRFVANGLTGRPAHPRVCGENTSPITHKLYERGSSPRVRGKQRPAHSSNQITGLIPACAGKTAYERRAREAHWAHPRVCGENALTAWNDFARGGSSPRVRGKPRMHSAW